MCICVLRASGFRGLCWLAPWWPPPALACGKSRRVQAEDAIVIDGQDAANLDNYGGGMPSSNPRVKPFIEAHPDQFVVLCVAGCSGKPKIVQLLPRPVKHAHGRIPAERRRSRRQGEGREEPVCRVRGRRRRLPRRLLRQAGPGGAAQFRSAAAAGDREAAAGGDVGSRASRSSLKKAPSRSTSILEPGPRASKRRGPSLRLAFSRPTASSPRRRSRLCKRAPSLMK